MARRSTFAVSRGLTVALFALAVSGVSSRRYQCPRNDPELEKCVENVVNELRPKLKSGDAEYKVPSLENLNIGDVHLVNIKDFHALAHNVILSGLSDFVIDKLRVDMKNRHIEFDVTVPKANLDSEIDVDVKLLAVPVTDKGPVSGHAKNVKAHVSMKFDVIERRNKPAKIYFPSITAKVAVADYQATFKPENPEKTPVTQAINSVITSSRTEIVASMIPSLEKAIAEKLLEIANTVAKRFTYEELFPLQ
ncbi:hypothetical protein QAD02_008647 [Eretmocerus hayati]|uniref:Uncharacterized protein n=1 Tax=Eretmocerus hayati TaxID=131215 RepID=A0ACC2N709_9HYME|nr:hypothetical protein QAD02_008647 [Eretmocerus hayati]